MSEYFREEFLLSVQNNGNEIRLYREHGYKTITCSYFMKWGPIGNCSNVTELLTKKGRNPSLGGAIRQFNQATIAMKKVKFDRL
jgi:hypothetical protein